MAVASVVHALWPTRVASTPGGGGDASDDNLRHTLRAELGFKVGTGKGAPCSLCYHASVGQRVPREGRLMPSEKVKLRGCSVRPGVPPATLTRTTVTAKRFEQDLACVSGERMETNETFLKINDNQGGFRVKFCRKARVCSPRSDSPVRCRMRAGKPQLQRAARVIREQPEVLLILNESFSWIVLAS